MRKNPKLSMNIDKQNFKKSFIVSLLYVGLGTISLLGVYPSDPFYSDWSIVGLLITIPVSFIGFGVIYMEANSYTLLLFVQSLVFLLLFFIVYTFLTRNQKKL